MDSFDSFLAWESASRDTLDVKRVYIDMAGDLAAGVVLSQIVFWHLPDPSTRKTKLRVRRDGHLWLVKARGEWWEECRVSLKQIVRIIPALVELGVIETRVYRFNGDPVTHIRLVRERFIELLDRQVREYEPEPDGEQTDVPEGVARKEPKGTHVRDQRERTLTETTTEITTENQTTPRPPSGELLTEPPVIPTRIDTPAFRRAWAEWIEYRISRGKKQAVTPRGAELSLKRLATLGPERAVLCIERSIANNWQGLFPESTPEPKQPPGRDRLTSYARETLIDALGLNGDTHVGSNGTCHPAVAGPDDGR